MLQGSMSILKRDSKDSQCSLSNKLYRYAIYNLVFVYDVGKKTAFFQSGKMNFKEFF